MKLVENVRDIKANIATIDEYLSKDEGSDDHETAQQLIRDDICFVVVRECDAYKFYPSRFVGYKNNNLDSHLMSAVDGRITTVAISKIFRANPISDSDEGWQTFENAYMRFCIDLGIAVRPQVPFRSKEKKGSGRKYWDSLRCSSSA